MTIQKGSLVLLKIGDGQVTENFTTIGGVRITEMELNNNSIEATNPESGAWRQLLGNAGIRSVSISATGLFADSAAEETLRGYAFAGSLDNYELHFGNGDMLSGAFHISEYQRSAVHDGEEEFSITLESGGVITFTTA